MTAPENLGTIGFVGLSHLGIVWSVCAAAKGMTVVSFDPDQGLCERLSRGMLPITEPGLAELLAAHHHRITFTSDAAALGRCVVVLLSADVPTDTQNRSDLTALQRLIPPMVAHAAPGATLVMMSQVPPGFTRQVQAQCDRQLREGACVLVYQVETLVFGRAVERALHPERFVIGCAHPKVPLPAAYAALLGAFDCPILQMRYESAELAKIAVNMFLVSAISTTNTLAEMCEAVGADWSDIAPALRLDQRIGPQAYLTPGLGIAGGNLERDLVTVSELAAAHGIDAGIVDAWHANSEHRRDWALAMLHEGVLSTQPDPRIAVWGLAYKPGTHSTKHSPAMALLEALRPFQVCVHDPCVTLDAAAGMGGAITQVPLALDACRGADALVVMTPWSDYARVDLSQVREMMRGRAIVDPFGALDRDVCSRLGFSYARLGQPRQRQEVPA